MVNSDVHLMTGWQPEFTFSCQISDIFENTKPLSALKLRFSQWQFPARLSAFLVEFYTNTVVALTIGDLLCRTSLKFRYSNPDQRFSAFGTGIP